MKIFFNKSAIYIFYILMLAKSVSLYAADEDRNKYSDTASEASLSTTYALNRHLNPFKIDIEVNNGVATLSGEVDNEVEKDLAEQLALGIDGIREVNNQLKIDKNQKNYNKSKKDNKEYTFMDKVEDANITAKVKSLLLWNGNTSGFEIDVDTRNRIVSLSGTVDSDMESQLSEQIAKNTDGVREVRNNLKVDKNSATRRMNDNNINDTWITGKIEASLLYNSGVDGTDIDTETKDGVVTLKGYVKDRNEKDKAISIAEKTRGVIEVKDKLKIK